MNLTRTKERHVIRLMKREAAHGQPPIDELARQFAYTALQEFEVAVSMIDARVIVARHFRD